MGVNLVSCTPAGEIKGKLVALYEAYDYVREGDDRDVVSVLNVLRV